MLCIAIVKKVRAASQVLLPFKLIYTAITPRSFAFTEVNNRLGFLNIKHSLEHLLQLSS